MKRVFLLILVACLPIISACSADKATGPTTFAENSVSVLKITSKPVTDPWSSLGLIAVGQNVIDSTDITSGHSLFFPEEAREQTFAIHGGEKIDIMLAVLSSVGTYSDAKQPGTYQFITDWKPVEPEKHNIKFDSGFEVIFMHESYPSDERGMFLEGGRATFRYESRRVPWTGAVLYQIKSNVPTVNFVNVAQVYRTSGCSGSTKGDSLTLRSQSGIGFITDGKIWGRIVNANREAQEITIRCTWYPSAEAARLAEGNVAASG
jgi:hypothetical protein